MKFLKGKWLYALIAITVIGAVAYYMTMGQTKQHVTGYTVDVGPVVKFVEDSAVAVDQNSYTYYSEVSAKIVKLNGAIGDVIKKGDTLIELDSTNITNQIAVLQAQRDSGAAYTDELRSPADSDLINQYANAVKKAELLVAELKRNLTNQRQLYQAGAVSLDSVQALQSKLSMAERDYAAAINQYNQAKDSTSANLIEQANSNVKSIDAQIISLKDELTKYTIVAQKNGTVVNKPVAQGQLVMAGTPLISIENPTGIILEVLLLSEDVDTLQEGATAIIYQNETVLDQATVSKIHPKAQAVLSDLGVQQRRVKVELTPEKQSLKLGYEYDVDVYLEQIEHLRIPDSAYFEIDQTGYVFVVRNEQLALAPVDIVLEGNDFYAVTGLQAGEVVVQSPSNQLAEGSAVNVQ